MRLVRAAHVIRCLGHPLRLRLLDALGDTDRTVSELQAATGAAQSTVSQHLSVLRGHGVVGARREGPYVYYRIADQSVRPILNCVRRATGMAVETGDTTGRDL